MSWNRPAPRWPARLGGALLAFLLLAGARPHPAPTLDPVMVEAERLWRQSGVRGQGAGGAVDLERLEELSEWIPRVWLDSRLKEAALDRGRSPLVRAVAWALRRDRALDALDAPGAAQAAQALGLLDGFAVRSGAAPHPTAALTPKGWSTYPAGLGAGTLRLETVIQPDQDTVATLAGRLVAPAEGPAVLRIGYDDEATVWLNGDEVYAAPAAHTHWIDQAAIPVVLRAGNNRLVVAVRQQADAWRFSIRVTDAAGEVLPVTLHPDPWGPVPEPAEGPPLVEGEEPVPPADLWATLNTAVDADPPDAQALRDLADHARRTGLPDREQAIPRVAIESAWEVEPSSASLLAWIRILPGEEQPAVRAAHDPVRPETLADTHAARMLALDDAWSHYYARRFRESQDLVAVLKAQDPNFIPFLRLEAVTLQELGLPSTAVRLLEAAQARFPDRVGLQRGRVAALRSAERVEEAITALEGLAAGGDARVDDVYQLASLRATRGETEAALALLDRVIRARPELRSFVLEAVDVELAAGREPAAVARLEALLARMPGDADAAIRLARLHRAAGRGAEAEALLRATLTAHPGDTSLTEALAELTRAAPEARLGPSIAELEPIASPAGAPAHVLYHHARSTVASTGRAVRRLRRVVRILTEEGGRRFASWELPYVPSTQRLILEEARLIRPGRPPLSPTRSDHDLSEPAYRLYYDLRAEVLDFPPLLPGDLVEVAWRLVDTDPDPTFAGYYGEVAWLQEVAPRAWSVVEFMGEGASALKLAVVSRGVSFQRDGLRVEARDVPGLPLEAGAPGPSSIRAHVHVSSLASWAELDTRYRALLADRDRPDQRLAALAQTWGGEGTPVEVLDRLYAAVAHRTRYVGLEFGVRSFRPEQPSVTLARGYGDCKDKATLLIALARARGIDARLTLVRTRAAGAVEAEPASFALFDHAIVYVPDQNRFLDPTVDRNDPHTLPPSDQGAQAFVLGLDTGLRVIPPESPAQGVSLVDIVGTLASDGSVAGQMTWTTRGQPATTARRSLEAEGARQQSLEALLGAWFPGASVKPEGFQGLTPAFDPVEVTAAVTLPGVARGGQSVPLGGAAWGVVGQYAQAAQRTLPLAVELQRTTRLTLRLNLGGRSARLPPTAEIRSRFGHFTAQATTAEGVLTVTAELVLATNEVSPTDYPAFRTWLAEVDQAAARSVEVGR